MGLNSPNCSTSCDETPKGIQCCKNEYSFGCLTGSIILQRTVEKWGGGEGLGGGLIGYCHRAQLPFLESYKPMSKGKPCSIA